MRISKASAVEVLFLCGWTARSVSVAATNDSPVLGADMPLYPVLARTAGIQGKVQIHVIIDADGKVISAEATSGHPVLTQAALKNIKTWRFAGANETTITYEFKIEPRETKEFDDYYRYGKIVFHPPSSVEIIFPPAIVVQN